MPLILLDGTHPDLVTRVLELFAIAIASVFPPAQFRPPRTLLAPGTGRQICGAAMLRRLAAACGLELSD